MKVLLSIKPEFAFKIFDGIKQFEFRRVIFKDPNVKTVVVYASSPIQKVIGEFEIDHIVNEDIKTLWELTQDQSGISEDYFLQYFEKKQKGYAIKVKNSTKYAEPLCIRKDFNASPPQSFIYL